MSFPNWAPAALVSEHAKILQEAEHYLQEFQHYTDGREAWISEFFTNHPNCYREAADSCGKLAETLCRLLTDDNMREVWSLITSRQPVTTTEAKEIPFLLWRTIRVAHVEFSRKLSSSRTPSEKKKGLLNVGRAAHEFAKTIKASPRAMQMQDTMVAHMLGDLANTTRSAYGDEPDIADRLRPTFQLSVDLLEGRKAAGGFGSPVRTAPIIDRLLFWVDTAERTSLLALLQLFEEAVQAESDVPDEIKQPARGHQYLRPYLTRRLSEFMQTNYGGPLDNVVAAIVAVCLDLDAMDRDAVRPYRKQRGKKSTTSRGKTSRP